MGNKVALVDQSTAGGIILGPGATTVTIDGFNVSLHGDYVMSHGMYEHIAATVTKDESKMKNQTVTIGGIKIVVDSDLATCGDTVSSSSSVSIG